MNIAKLKKAAKIGALVVLAVAVVFAVLIGGLFAGAHHENQAAEERANAFCGHMVEGSRISVWTARAEQAGIRYWYDERNAVYEFQFPGFMLDSAHCEVRAQESRVVSTRTFLVHD